MVYRPDVVRMIPTGIRSVTIHFTVYIDSHMVFYPSTCWFLRLETKSRIAGGAVDIASRRNLNQNHNIL